MPLSGQKVIDVPEQAMLSVRLEVPCGDLGRHLGPALEKVMARALAAGASPGRSVVRRLDSDDATDRVEAGVCVSEDAEGDDEVRRTVLPKARVARAISVGAYRCLDEAHDELAAWARTQGLQPAGSPWEVHLTDPGDESDPDRARAQLYLPVKPSA